GGQRPARTAGGSDREARDRSRGAQPRDVVAIVVDQRSRRGKPRMIEVRVPDIGDFDQVDVDESLITLESEKASMDVPAPSAGVVKEVAVKVGDKVGEGALIVTLEVEGDG